MPLMAPHPIIPTFNLRIVCSCVATLHGIGKWMRRKALSGTRRARERDLQLHCGGRESDFHCTLLPLCGLFLMRGPNKRAPVWGRGAVKVSGGLDDGICEGWRF